MKTEIEHCRYFDAKNIKLSLSCPIQKGEIPYSPDEKTIYCCLGIDKECDHYKP